MAHNTLFIFILLSILSFLTVIVLATDTNVPFESEVAPSNESIDEFTTDAHSKQGFVEGSTHLPDHDSICFSPTEEIIFEKDFENPQMEIPQPIFDFHTCICNCFKYSRNCEEFKNCIRRCIGNWAC
ncbi:hypothetical protein C1645_787336 [Glomus cerebriforme]|uniref:Transmembrane protein n=1 Tax=Glomus cerebriforme TaxID=658196 RepID=A0A397SBV5_9GLOM|nr:hypothetical protein C1645_787336 [Glomus cerebriforme]